MENKRTYEQRIADMVAKSQAREQQKRDEFMSKVNKVITVNDGLYPYITVTIETTKNYSCYRIIKYPTGAIGYELTMYDKKFLDIYREHRYFYGEIPKCHKAQFESLEQLFA